MMGVCFASREKNVQCRLCQQLVAPPDWINHAADKHMEATLKCPVDGCDFETTCSLFLSSERFNRHKVGGFSGDWLGNSDMDG